jgi:hypothetical protein
MIPTLLFCFREDGEGIRKHRVNAFYFLCVIQDVRLVSYKVWFSHDKIRILINRIIVLLSLRPVSRLGLERYIVVIRTLNKNFPRNM